MSFYGKVIEAKMDFVLALIEYGADPREIATHVRDIAYNPVPFEPVTGDDQIAFTGLAGSAWRLERMWERHLEAHRVLYKEHTLYEPALIRMMEEHFARVRGAMHKQRLAALDALGDPANWPFDPDLSPEHETNVEAAKAHNVTYKPGLRQYVDEDGCPRFDAFGQPL